MQRSIDFYEQIKIIDGDLIASHSLEGTVEKLKELNLLQNQAPQCRKGVSCTYMRVVKDSSRLDGMIYRCAKCDSKKSLRYDSMFEDTRLPIGSFYRLFYAFAHDYSTTEAIAFAGCERSSVKDVFRYLRRVISSHIEAERQLTTLGHVVGALQGGVEMDESLVTHIHPNEDYTDRNSTQIWVFGMIERNSNRFVLYALGNATHKTTEVIRPLVQRHIPTTQAQQTRVYTDGALFYSFLSAANYNHTVIVHDQGFGQGDNTTNHVEALWSRLKAKGHFSDGKNFYTVQEVQEEVDVIKWRMDTPRDELFRSLAAVCSNYFRQTHQKIRDHN